MTPAELNTILRNQPKLSAAGFRTSHWDGADEDFADNRQWLRDRIGQVNDSIRFLEQCSRTKTFRKSRSSYGLKHDAENMEGNSYVCNGAMIVALIHLGFRYKHDGKDSPNIDVAIKVPDHLWN